MATQTTPVSQAVMQRLPLRELGFEHVPAVPVDIRGDARHASSSSASRRRCTSRPSRVSPRRTRSADRPPAPTTSYTATTGPARSGGRRASACTASCGRNPPEIHAALAAEKIDERHDERAAGHDLTTLSLEDPQAVVDGLDDAPGRLQPGHGARRRVGGDGGRRRSPTRRPRRSLRRSRATAGPTT